MSDESVVQMSRCGEMVSKKRSDRRRKTKAKAKRQITKAATGKRKQGKENMRMMRESGSSTNDDRGNECEHPTITHTSLETSGG